MVSNRCCRVVGGIVSRVTVIVGLTGREGGMVGVSTTSSPSSDALRPRDREREWCVARARPRPRCRELARLTSSDGLSSLSAVPSLHVTGCAVFLAFVRVVALARVMLVRASPGVLVWLSSSLAAAAAAGARCWSLVRTVGRSLLALSVSELRVSLVGWECVLESV